MSQVTLQRLRNGSQREILQSLSYNLPDNLFIFADSSKFKVVPKELLVALYKLHFCHGYILQKGDFIIINDTYSIYGNKKILSDIFVPGAKVIVAQELSSQKIFEKMANTNNIIAMRTVKDFENDKGLIVATNPIKELILDFNGFREVDIEIGRTIFV